jgi:hypothetical protein
MERRPAPKKKAASFEAALVCRVEGGERADHVGGFGGLIWPAPLKANSKTSIQLDTISFVVGRRSSTRFVCLGYFARVAHALVPKLVDALLTVFGPSAVAVCFSFLGAKAFTLNATLQRLHERNAY